MAIPRGISEASASRVAVTALLSLFVTGSLASLGLQFSHQYTASVGLLGALDAGPGRINSTAGSTELPAVAEAALTQDAVAEIDRRVHPYTALASKMFPKWTASRLRSQLSVQSIYTGSTMGAITVSFSGNNRKDALAVTSAVAELLVQIQDAVPVPPGIAPPAQQTSRQTSVTPSLAPPAAAQPIPGSTTSDSASLGTAAGEEAAQLRAIRQVRTELGAIAHSSEDLQSQIQSGTDSLAAIEEEKEHLRQASLMAPPAPKPIPPPPDPRRALLQSKLDAYEKVLAALRDRYTEDYPDVVNARERVEELQGEIAQLPRPVVPMERREASKPASDIPQRLAALDERELPIQNSLEQMRAKLSEGEARAAELRRLLTSLPAKAEAARNAAAEAPPPPAPKIEQVAPRPLEAIPSGPQFSVATAAEIRKTEEILSPELISAASISCGLAVGFAYLALGARRGGRRPTEEAEPEAAVV
ncbi:MAG TPA: hypothetical protein VGD64_03890 [Acidisarcina sp.]